VQARCSLRLFGGTAAILLTVGLLEPAVAADVDSVTITAPEDGSSFYLYGRLDDPSVAAEPLVVTFTASGSPVTCSMDDQPAVACTSPVSYDDMTAGPHAVTVNAGSATETSRFTLGTVVLGDPPVAPKVDARVHARWRVHHRRTWARRLVLGHIEGRARVTLTCRGRSCPARLLYARTVSDHAYLTPALRGRALRPHTKLVIRVVKSGFVSERFVYVIRRHAPPRLAIDWYPA
jgi:hypothetical protein